MTAQPTRGARSAAEILETFLRGIPPELKAPEADSPRGRILAAAREVFSERGFAASTTRAIAAAARVNMAMLHYYFGNKQRLYLWVVAAEFQAMIRAIAGRIDPARPAEEILIALPIGILRELEDDPVRGNLLRREVGGGARHLQQVIAELGAAGPPGMRQLVRPLIREAQKRGRLPQMPPEMIMQFLLSVAYGALFLDPLFALITGRDPQDPAFRRRRRRAMETLLRRGLLLQEVDR